ncbi:ABC-three component system middle component 6 [Williamsia soli]|uniref:ABC-three component system middle component 6 n=1 Tax=Williamsia soli TaxID=364929 RepID=UPI003558ED8C
MSLLLPSKHVSVEHALLTQAEKLYANISDNSPVAQCWLRCRVAFPTVSFNRFVLMLDTLYALEIVELDGDNIIKRRQIDALED